MAVQYPDLNLYINGRWISSEQRSVHRVLNPATGETLGELPLASADDLDEALDAARRGFAVWRNTPADARAATMRKAAGLLRERADAIAPLLTMENGKPLGESHWEINFAAAVLDWYAEEARRIYGRILPSQSTNDHRSVVMEPVGPVAGFAPWNVPVVLTGNKIAAALASGCSIIVKPAEETPAAILAYMRVLHDAGVPPGVVNMVFGVPSEVSSHLLASPIIRKVSFTGSTAVGKQLAALAARDLKRITLELGGHAPVLIFDDADIDSAVETLSIFKFFNAGQVCFAPTRFFVQENVHDRFVAAFAERARALKVGNGLDEGIQMGPLANDRRLTTLRGLIDDAVGAGATLGIGDQSRDGPGNWFAPTILTDVSPAARIMQEEPFGPVALIGRFQKLDEVIERANAVPYGLSAFAFTRSASIAHAVTRDLNCGLVGINNCLLASPDAPFGGVKDSGYGYDYGHEAIDGHLSKKFVNNLILS